MAQAPTQAAIFAGNRAVGRVALSVAARAGTSHRERVREAGSLRIRFPNSAASTMLDAVLVNTAGGMTGGDRFGIDIAVGHGARLSVTTAAAEKIYRSVRADVEIDVGLKVASGGFLAWLPQETILFDQSRLRRDLRIELTGDAELILCEAAVFGRSAMGETVGSGRFFDRWRVRRDGLLIFADTVSLDGKIARLLARRAATRGGVAVASVLKIPGDEAAIAAIRAIADNLAGEAGVSTWNGLALVRLIAADGVVLRRDLARVLGALNRLPLPRLWSN